jgi:hypothetical protein
MSGGPSAGCDGYWRSHIPSVGLDDEGLVFVSFEFNGSMGESVITKGKFNELGDQCGVGLAW